MRRSLRAFTLIELLVVSSIVALLIALLLPAIKRAKTYTLRVMCMNNHRQVALAHLTYERDYGGWVYRRFTWPHVLSSSQTGNAGWAIPFDIRPAMEPYGDPEIYYCPDGGHPRGPDEPRGWRTPGTAVCNYTIFAGIDDTDHNEQPGYFPIPPDVAEDPLIGSHVVMQPSLCPLSSDLTFWLGRWPILHNHPYWTGYDQSQHSPIYDGQASGFVDGHAEWRDPQTILRKIISRHSKFGGGVFLY